MTYIARVNNAFNGLLYLSVKHNGGDISKIRIPARRDLIKAALSTYQDLKYRPAKDVPKSIKNLKIGNHLDARA